jgi:hypothetical protein
MSDNDCDANQASDEVPSEIPQWHREILDARLAQAEANPSAVVPWREVVEGLSRPSGTPRE